MKKLIKEICTKEGKKHQVSVADVREILKIFTLLMITNDVMANEWQLYLDKCRIKHYAAEKKKRK